MITEHRDYMPDPKDFDYSIFEKMIEEFPNFCDIEEKNPVVGEEGLKHLLKPEAVMAYLTWCLSKKKKFDIRIKSPDEIKTSINPDFSNPNHLRFMRDTYIINRKRLKGTLPTNELGYKQATEAFQESPEIFRAVETFKKFLKDYLTCLQEIGQTEERLGYDPDDFTSRSLRMTIMILHNGLRAGFLVEFAPLIGMQIENGEVNFPAALHQIFAAPNVFKAISIDLERGDEDGYVNHTCPFMAAGTDSLTKHFVPSAVNSQSSLKAGGILVAIIEKYRELGVPSITGKPTGP